MFDIRHSVASLLFLAGVTVLPVSARAAQSYDSCAGFIDSLPATISTQGVWCLRHDLSTAVTSGNAITIAANNVTIDCNDFKIGGLAAGNSSQAKGIYSENRQNATVRHCNVRGFYYGIQLTGGAGHLVQENRLDQNLRFGIYVSGENNRVVRNAVYDTGGAPSSNQSYGIYASARIIDNDVAGVFATATPGWVYGISAYGDVANNNRVYGLVPNNNGSGGYAIGISGYSNLTSAVGNQVTGGIFATPGTGINSMRFCSNNTVTAFASAYGSCASSIGNLP